MKSFFKISLYNQNIVIYLHSNKLNTMNITRKSTLTGNLNTMNINITENQLLRIEQRRETKELIQDIVPHLCNEDREFLISGITNEESIRMFGEID